MMGADKVVDEIGTSRGAYVLVIQLDQLIKIEIGRLGFVSFGTGYYLYTGSALGPGGLSGRIHRHLRHESQKRSHWHIDALTSRGEITEIWLLGCAYHLECTWAEILSKVGDRSVLGFGASDCGCAGHLVWLQDACEVERAWEGLREHVGVKLRRVRNTETIPNIP
ncbi:MAG TPA: GIY-YIG nuclease family protein [Anaerolineae bacterium]|nr:GIY-YIG nuclease family protein [Anaerolineae bacterium]